MSIQQQVSAAAGKVNVASDAYKRAGQVLFGDGNLMLAPGAIVDALKLAGFKVPTQANVALESAQIIMAGGQIVSDVETGASIGSYVSPVGAVVQGTLSIMEQCGLVDPTSPAAELITLGVDAALVVAGGGFNVIADVKFLIDTAMDVMSAMNAGQKVKEDSQRNLAKFISDSQSGERDAFAKNYCKYQSGQLDLFEFMNAVATQSPQLFDNYFPQVGAFLPSGVIQYINKTTESTLFGGQRDYTSEKDIIEVLGGVSNMQNALLWAYVIAPLKNFAVLDQASTDEQTLLKYGFPKGLLKHPHPVHRISTHSMSILSMLPPYFNVIPDNFNIIPTLVAFDLCPHDIDGSPIYDEVNASEFSSTSSSDFFPKVQRQFATPPGFGVQGSFQGNQDGYLSALKQAPIQQIQVVENDRGYGIYDPQSAYKQHLLDLDNWRVMNSSRELLSTREGYWICREWGVLPNIPDPAGQSPDGIPSYRKLHDYWASIALLDRILKDKFFNDFTQNLPDFAHYVQILDDVEQRHKDLQFKIVGRRMNRKAMNIIANIFNTTTDKLNLKTKHTQGPAVFGVN